MICTVPPMNTIPSAMNCSRQPRSSESVQQYSGIAQNPATPYLLSCSHSVFSVSVPMALRVKECKRGHSTLLDLPDQGD